jgi:hypothetical protein
MRKQTIIAVLLAACIISTVIPSSIALESLSKPTVNVPTNWRLDNETPYPNIEGEHDPEGSGLLEYVDQEDSDSVFIYYESALGMTYSNDALEAEVVAVFQKYRNDSISESGIMTVAGVSAGYAKGINSEYDYWILDLVFVENNYYIYVSAAYDPNLEDENQVTSLINSINVGAAEGEDFAAGGFIIIGAIIVVAVLVAVIVYKIMKRPKKPPAPTTIRLEPVLGSKPPRLAVSII